MFTGSMSMMMTKCGILRVTYIMKEPLEYNLHNKDRTNDDKICCDCSKITITSVI